jgi:hypothetical protein
LRELGEEAFMTRRFVLALIAAALLAASVLAQPAAQAKSSAKDAARSALRLWPRQVYAPYFETWTSDRSR